MGDANRVRVAVACQGGGSHTAFTGGVLEGLLGDLPGGVEVVALSGTSGGAICAALAWDGLVRDDPPRAVANLKAFWRAMAATEPWDQFANHALQAVVSLRETVGLPAVSPYMLPPWGADHFRAVLERTFDFAELRGLARRPGAPALHVGAVEVLTGHFDIFTGEELSVECLLASAAIPELFRAVKVPGRGVYWDGLFSQNPPIHDLTDFDIRELWVVQINPSTCARVPDDVTEITDRRNALAGNLSMEQELRMIEMINRSIANGRLNDPKFHPITVRRVELDRELGYRSKLDRRAEFLEELRQYGKAKARWFLKDRAAKLYTLKALGVSATGAAAAALLSEANSNGG